MHTRANQRSHLLPVAGLMLVLAGLSPASANPPGPVNVRTSPDGKRLYVLSTTGLLHVFDTTTNQPLASIRVAANGLASLTPCLAVSPDGARIYIARPHEKYPASQNGTLLVIDSATNRSLAAVDVGADPGEVAVSPDGRRVYVNNWGSQMVSVVDAETLHQVSTVPVYANPKGLAVSPDGALVFVSYNASTYTRPSTKDPS